MKKKKKEDKGEEATEFDLAGRRISGEGRRQTTWEKNGSAGNGVVGGEFI